MTHMSTVARKYTLLSAADYLAADNDGTWKHEFVDGAVYAMSGASENHNLIRGGIAGFLNDRVGDACRVFSEGMKLQIRTNDRERYYYPDVFVCCDPEDREPYFKSSATLVVEVLSPSTERVDRTEKFEAYASLPSVMEYALVSQTAVEMELFRRRTGWKREFYQQDNVVTFESVGLSVSLSIFYRRVVF